MNSNGHDKKANIINPNTAELIFLLRLKKHAKYKTTARELKEIIAL